MDKNKYLQSEINKCSICGNLPKLKEKSIQIGKTSFIVIGESPAKDGWIVSKRAFYNKDNKLQASGRVLEKLLNNIGLSINDIYFTECCKCIIENRQQLEKCSKNCLPFLFKQIENLPCRILVPMGLAPTQALLGIKIKRYADFVGKIFEIKISNKIYKVLPIYHPSPLNPKGYKDNIPIFDVLKNM